MLVSHDGHGGMPLGSVHWVVAVSTCARLHAPAPPAGLAELTTLPLSSPATHSVADAHESVRSGCRSTVLVAHAPGPPAGSVDVSTLTGAVDRHAQRCRRTRDGVQRMRVDVSDTPRARAAPGRIGGAHDIPGPIDSYAQRRRRAGHRREPHRVRPKPRSTCATFHAAAPPPGSVELSTLPPLSTATHNAADGHEIATRALHWRPDSSLRYPPRPDAAGRIRRGDHGALARSPPRKTIRSDTRTPMGTGMSGSYGGGWSMTIGALQEIGPAATAEALVISAATHTAISTATTTPSSGVPERPTSIDAVPWRQRVMDWSGRAAGQGIVASGHLLCGSRLWGQFSWALSGVPAWLQVSVCPESDSWLSCKAGAGLRRSELGW